MLEMSHNIIFPVSYILAAPFFPLQTREQTHLNDTRIHQVAESTAALMYTALLSSRQASGHGFTSVTGWVTKPVAFEMLRDELYSDPFLCWLIYTAYWDCVTVHTARSSF